LTPLLALNHRELILSHLPADGLMLEWGCGGSTRWFLDRLIGGQKLVTVEHDERWLRQCGIAHRDWIPRLQLPTAHIGQNATQWEESPVGLAGYICAPEASQADVILIDGIARSACLAWAAMNAKSGTRVFLHDVANSKDLEGKPVDRMRWYVWAMNSPRLRDSQIVPAAPGEYPPSMWCATVK